MLQYSIALSTHLHRLHAYSPEYKPTRCVLGAGQRGNCRKTIHELDIFERIDWTEYQPWLSEDGYRRMWVSDIALHHRLRRKLPPADRHGVAYWRDDRVESSAHVSGRTHCFHELLVIVWRILLGKPSRCVPPLHWDSDCHAGLRAAGAEQEPNEWVETILERQ